MFLCLILNNYIVIIVILGGEKIVVKFTFTTCINDFFPCEFVIEILHTDVSFNLFARWVFLAIR